MPTGGMVSTVVLDGGHDVQESEHGLGSIGSVEFVGSIGSLGLSGHWVRWICSSGAIRLADFVDIVGCVLRTKSFPPKAINATGNHEFDISIVLSTALLIVLLGLRPTGNELPVSPY